MQNPPNPAYPPKPPLSLQNCPQSIQVIINNLFLQLRLIHGADLAWFSYLYTEVHPLLVAGYIPAIGEGFTRFLQSPDISTQVNFLMQHNLSMNEPQPYDSHPLLRQRMLVAELLTSSADNPDESQSAQTLLNNEDAHNLYFAPRMDPSIAGRKLTPIAWEEVIEKETIPNWAAAVARYFRLFDGHSIGSLPEAVTKVRHIGQQILDPPGQILSPEERAERAADLLSAALALALYRNGWTVYSQPGSHYLKKQKFKLMPNQIIEQLRSKQMTQNAWQAVSSNLGISDISLSPPAET